METTLIGQTAAKLMDGIEHRDGQVIAVAIVTVIDEDEGETTYTRAEFSSERLYEQLGLLHAGVALVHNGTPPEEDEE